MNRVHPHDDEQRGGALLLALMTIVAESTSSMAILRVSSSATRRLDASVDQKQALNIAEAGLAESYNGLIAGSTGQMASIGSPAGYAGRLVWVDAEERPDETVGFLDQVDGGRIAIDPTTPWPYLNYNEENHLLFHEGVFYRICAIAGNDYSLDTALEHKEHPELGIDWDDFIDGDGQFSQNIQVKTDSNGTVHASHGSILGSIYVGKVDRDEGSAYLNDYLCVSEDGNIYSSSGVNLGSVGSGALSACLGSNDACSEIKAVLSYFAEIPHIGWQGSPPPEEQVASPLSEIGPTTVVAGSLDLEDSASLTLDNSGGPLDLYVLSATNMALGARVSVVSSDPSDLSLQVEGSAQVGLHATSRFNGLVYAPDAPVSVEAPFETYGALVGNSLASGSGFQIHLDSGFIARRSVPRLLSWKIEEVPTRIARSNVDPVDLFGMDGEEAKSMNDTQKSTSFRLIVSYLNNKGDECELDGPIEDRDFSTAAYISS